MRLVEFAVGMILAAAVLSKIARPDDFAGALERFNVIPKMAGRPLAVSIILIEAVLSVLLVSNIAPELGLAAGAALFATFSLASWLELSRQGAESGAECGCLGGVLRLRHGRGTVVLNIIVSLLCLSSLIALVTSSNADSDLGTAFLSGLAFLLAALYWLTQYAISVITQMQLDIEAPRRQS